MKRTILALAGLVLAVPVGAAARGYNYQYGYGYAAPSVAPSYAAPGCRSLGCNYAYAPPAPRPDCHRCAPPAYNGVGPDYAQPRYSYNYSGQAYAAPAYDYSYSYQTAQPSYDYSYSQSYAAPSQSYGYQSYSYDQTYDYRYQPAPQPYVEPYPPAVDYPDYGPDEGPVPLYGGPSYYSRYGERG